MSELLFSSIKVALKRNKNANFAIGLNWLDI